VATPRRAGGRGRDLAVGAVIGLLVVAAGLAVWWAVARGTAGPIPEVAGPAPSGAIPARGEPPLRTDAEPLEGSLDLEALDEELGPPLDYDADRTEADAAATMLQTIVDDAGVAAAAAPGTLDELEDQGGGVSGALPDGARLVPDPQTWVRRGNLALMVVDVQLPDVTTPDTFVVWLLRDPAGAGWRISSTEQVVEEGATS
jgi:hypothetical protein